MPNRRWPIILLLLAALAIRLAWGLSQPAEPTAALPDQLEYLAIARNVLLGRGFEFADERFGEDSVYAFRSPGYPALVAILGASPRVVRAAQAVIDTSTVLAIYLLARRWLDERSALIAAALVAFNPFLIFFTGLLLTETLFTAALAWGVCSIGQSTYGGRRATWSGYFVGLLCFAIAVIVRPAVMFLPPLICAVAGWPSIRRAVGGAIVGAAVVVLTLLPWAYRNQQLLGRWIWTTTNTGQTTYDGFRPGADGSSDLSLLPAMPELRGLGEVERNDRLEQLGRQAMLQNLPRSIGLAARKIARTWSPLPLSDEYASARNRLAGLAYAVPVFVLTVIGLFRTRISGSAKMLCLLPAVYFTAGVAITVGSLRYRLPAEPPMMVLAASVFAKKSSRIGNSSIAS